MGWGGLLGAGKGLSAVGESMQEDLKTLRIQEWKSKQDEINRQFESDKLDKRIAADDARSKAEQDARSEESRLNRESNERIASTRATGRAGGMGFELVKDDMGNPIGRFNKYTGEMEQFNQGGSGELSDQQIIDAIQQSRTKGGEKVSADEEKIDLNASLNKPGLLAQQSEKSDRQIANYDKWLESASADLPSLTSVDLSGKDGFFGGKSDAAMNRLSHHLNLLQQVIDNGTPEQKQKAINIYNKFNSKR